MASMLRSIRRKKSKAHEFQLTASVSALTIECVKTWQPTKLVIVWNKESPKLSSTKPVRWQSVIKNPSRGIHVWPEPDPVQCKLKLLKNSGKELLQYQDKPWTILVQNVSASGRRKIIATGHIDLADYITEEPSSHDITVTLRPATKNVVTGSLEFSLSSVLLEDGIPRRWDKEILDEILQNVVKSRKQSLLKTTISNGSAAPKTVEKSLAPAPPLSSKSRPAPPPPHSAKSRPAPPPPLPSNSRPAPPPPLPVKSRSAPPPSQHASSQPTPSKPRPPRPPPPSQPKQDVKVNNTLKHTEEKAANDDKRLSGMKRKVKYPKDLNPFASSSEESLPSNGQTSSKCVLGQEPGNQEEVQLSSSRRKRKRRKKKAEKYPKEFNPFGEEPSNDEQGSLSSESESHPCKATPEKDSKVINGPGTCKDLDKGDGKEKDNSAGDVIVPKNDSSDIEQGGAVLLETSLVQDEPALEKAMPYEPGDGDSELEQSNGEESVKQMEGVYRRCSKPDDSPGTCKDIDEGDGKDKGTNDGDAIVPKNDSSDIEQGGAVLLETSLVQDEPALEKAMPYVPGDGDSELEQSNGEESVKQIEGVYRRCSKPDDSPGTCKDIDEGDGKDKGTNDGDAIVPKNDSSDIEQGGAVLLETSLVQDEPALEKAMPCVPGDGDSELEQSNGEESVKQKEGVYRRCSKPDDSPGTCKDIDEGDGKDKGTNDGDAIVPKNDSSDIEQGGAVLLETSLVQDEPALEKAMPYVPGDGDSELEQSNGEESVKQKEGVYRRCSKPDDSPGTCKDIDEGDGKDKGTNDGDAIVPKNDSSDIEQGGAVLLETSLVQDEPALEKAMPCVPGDGDSELEQSNGEESVKQKEGVYRRCSKPDDSPGTCKDIDEGDGKDKGTNDGDAIVPKNDSSDIEQGGAVLLETSLVRNEPAIEKSTPYVPVDVVSELEQGNGEELSKQKEGIDDHCSTPDDGPRTCKDLVECDSKGKGTNNGDAIFPKNVSSDIEQGGAIFLEKSLNRDEPSLEKAEPHVPVDVVNKLEQGNEEVVDWPCRRPDVPALNREKPHVQVFAVELEEDNRKESSERKEGDGALCSNSDEPSQQIAKFSSPSVVKGEFEQANGEESLGRKEGGDNHCYNSVNPVLNGEKPYVSVVGIKKLEEAKDEKSSKQQEQENDNCSTADEPVLKRAKPYVPVISVDELQRAKHEELAKQQEGDNGLWSTPDEPVLKMAKPYVPDEELEETWDKESAKPQEENGLCSTRGKPFLKRAKPYVAVDVHKERVEDKGENSEAPDPFQVNQHENEQAAPLDSQHCRELSMYAQEQIFLLQEEIASLEKVSIKLEMELLQAMKTKDCEEELDGLTQDWLTLTKYRGELMERKQDLEILNKQRNFDDCCKIIRKELKFLFELEDWRKTDENRAHEQKFLTLLLQFVNKKYSIAQTH